MALSKEFLEAETKEGERIVETNKKIMEKEKIFPNHHELDVYLRTSYIDGEFDAVYTNVNPTAAAYALGNLIDNLLEDFDDIGIEVNEEQFFESIKDAFKLIRDDSCNEKCESCTQKDDCDIYAETEEMIRIANENKKLN